METTAYHSTYNDYLIHKTVQKKPLRNFISDPNFNFKHNLPLYINYQFSELRKSKEKQKTDVDYQSIHNNITQRIERINELSLINEKTPNYKNYENYIKNQKAIKKNIDITSFKENMVKSLYNKIYKKNESSNSIDKYFTYQTPASIIFHKKAENKEKASIENNLKMIMSEKIEDDTFMHLFKKFSALRLKRNIIEEKNLKNLKEDPKALDFESRYDSLYKKSQIKQKEYSQTLQELCRIHKINISKLLSLPQVEMNQDFIKRYSSIIRSKDLARLQKMSEESAQKQNVLKPKRKKKNKNIFHSSYFNELLNEPEFSLEREVPQALSLSKHKTLSLDLQKIPNSNEKFDSFKNKGGLSNRHPSNLRTHSNDYSFSCKKHTSNIDVLCTDRNEKIETAEKVKNFLGECQSELELFEKEKKQFGKKIRLTQKKAVGAFNRLKKKNQHVGVSNTFQEFMNQREFKRKLINNLIQQSSEAEKNYILVTTKQKKLFQFE